MLCKLALAFERFQIRLVRRMMLSIASHSQRGGNQSVNVIRAILPAWNELIARKGACFDPELRASARSMLLRQLPEDAWSLIPSLEKRESPVINTWIYQNEVMTWDIQPSDIVLDIGSGGWPFKRADHLADKFPDGTTHRIESIKRDQRPFFEVDLQRLPFKNQEYDFVFCSHVLEHTDNPGQAIRELIRVGRRGYIEVPTRLSDVMFNFTRLPNHHRWHGLVLGNTLVLIEWNDWERRELGNNFFEALHAEYANAFQDFFERNRDLFFASCHWQGEISFLVIDKRGGVIDSSHVNDPGDKFRAS